MNAEPNIRLHEIRQKLQRYNYLEGTVVVSALTEESEKIWTDYLREENLAKQKASQ